MEIYEERFLDQKAIIANHPVHTLFKQEAQQ